MLYQVLLLLTLLILIYLYEKDICVKNNTTSLSKEGYIKLGNIRKMDALKLLPKGYVFLNYKYVIRGCSLSTYHRDVTSSKHILGTKHKVYTFIRYYNKGPQISVCPGSHATVPFTFSRGVNIYGDIGDCYIFDCDLVHAGAINIFGDNRHVEQYKIAHVDDILKLEDLLGIDKLQIGKCDLSPSYEYIMRKLSLLFAYPVNHILTPYLQKDKKSTFGNLLLSIYGRKFYNK
jgi:hypothetical protein